jgi:predicted ester cyclase
MALTPDAVVRAWFKEVWDEGREEAIDRLADANLIAHGLGSPGDPPIRGTAEFKQLFRVFRQALGDLQISVEKSVTEGDHCAVYCRVKGRHVGDAFGGAPTKRPVEFGGLVIAIVRDGRIVEGWNCFDFLGMYQQIGWVTNPPAPAEKRRAAVNKRAAPKVPKKKTVSDRRRPRRRSRARSAPPRRRR